MKTHLFASYLAWATALSLVTSAVSAYDVTDRFSIGGILAGAGQYQDLSGDLEGAENDDGGAFIFQPELSFRPTDQDEIFAKFGFAAGNGLNEKSPFAVAPWGAQLEDDVKDINGRNRDYLLTAWYKHTFQLRPENSLGLTLGLIDSTDYLDDNAFANDEFTQFMNDIFVNNPNLFLPVFDTGGAVEWDIGKVSLRGVVMNVGENDDGNSFNYFGGQIGYTVETAKGEGTYRIVAGTSSRDFLDPSGTSLEKIVSFLFSFDQELGDTLGVFARVGFADDKPAVDYKALYSGGINVNGNAWGRQNDNAGLAYAYVDGGNLDIDYTHVAEAYMRFVFNTVAALTLDVQYMRDELKGGGGPKGFIYGARLTAEF